MAAHQARFSPALALAVLAMLVSCAWAKEHLVRLNITNRFDPPSPTVTVHCKSKNDDLGFHDLAPGGTWGFQFHPRIITGTLFFCRFMWAQTFEYFDIYDYNRDKCNDCCWTVRAKGPCLCPCGQPCEFDFKQCWLWNKKKA